MVDYYTGPDGEQVSAMRVDPKHVTVISIWCHGSIVEEIDPFTGERFPALNVACTDEMKRASVGDYVIKKADGSFDVQGPNKFSSQHQVR